MNSGALFLPKKAKAEGKKKSHKYNGVDPKVCWIYNEDMENKGGKCVCFITLVGNSSSAPFPCWYNTPKVSCSSDFSLTRDEVRENY